MWALRGLRNGVLTTRWPSRPDAYAAGTRGVATVREPGPAANLPDLAGLCPTGAISTVAISTVAITTGAAGRVRLDQGRCIACGRCVTARPDVFAWSAGPGAARLTRASLVVPAEESPAALAAVSSSLRARTRALRRSVHLRHVDTGSDGSEEWEILALQNPVYDIHRLGMFFTASPRHADVLLVTGPGANGMAEPLRQTYDGMPHPKVVVAVGSEAVGGGLASPSATSGGIGGLVPVDVWLPGSPPSPFAIMHALLLALDRLPPAAEGGDLP
jgi:Ni,Fe-hydrogenase III small subunit/ferredoxin